MIKIKNKSNCTGCYACSQICPKKCINMNIDCEGFWYPEVNKSECINCNLCEEICPLLNKEMNNEFEEKKIEAYGCYNLDENIRMQSSSGGIFTLIAEEILNQNGVVFGAVFNEEFQVEHIYLDNKKDLQKLRGSKYVQSKILNTYSETKRFLDEGKFVFFTGTPCQISGLKHFLKHKKYENLITADLICHGVPSPLIWKKYLESLNKKNKIKKISFRDKSTGWKVYSFKVKYDNEEEFNESVVDNIYIQGFLRNIYLRPSCYKCKYKSLEREADITLADFWGIENILPKLNDNKGASLIFINSLKGEKMFKSISEKIKYERINIEEALNYNTSAIKSVGLTRSRKLFFKDILYLEEDIEKIIKKHLELSFIDRIILKINKLTNK